MQRVQPPGIENILIAPLQQSATSQFRPSPAAAIEHDGPGLVATNRGGQRIRIRVIDTTGVGKMAIGVLALTAHVYDQRASVDLFPAGAGRSARTLTLKKIEATGDFLTS